MTELTREHFDKVLKAVVARVATKKDLEEQTDALARITNAAFETQNQWLKQEFAAIRRDLDTRKRLDQYDRNFLKLEKALNVKF